MYSKIISCISYYSLTVINRKIVKNTNIFIYLKELFLIHFEEDIFASSKAFLISLLILSKPNCRKNTSYVNRTYFLIIY